LLTGNRRMVSDAVLDGFTGDVLLPDAACQ
jgi:hypothetical protein